MIFPTVLSFYATLTAHVGCCFCFAFSFQQLVYSLHCTHLSFSPGINDKRFFFPVIIFPLAATKDTSYILPVAACTLVLHRLIVVCLFFLLFANFFGSCIIEPTWHSFFLPNSAFFFHLCDNCSPDARFIVVLTDARFIVVLCHLHLLFLPDWPLQTSLFCFCDCHLPANYYLSTSPHFCHLWACMNIAFS